MYYLTKEKPWMLLLIGLHKCLHCCLTSQEDSEDGETERRPSDDLVSEAEPAMEDGEAHSETFNFYEIFKFFVAASQSTVS